MTSPSSSPSPETLLRHSGFLAALARELVRDEHEAQDLVQETWVAALGRPPEKIGSLRGWLAIVMANRARNWRRGASRRGQRETIAARPEQVEPGEGALERLETQRALIDLLLELPEAQRIVLYLRYYEERTPTQIARQLGVPVKTVKTRHTRGITGLREALDRRSGGDRRAWVSALAPLGAVRPAAVSASRLLVPAAATVTLALALAAVGAWWAGRPAADERVAMAPVAAAEPPPARAAAQVPDEARRPIETPAGPDVAPSCVLEGDVRLRETGAGVAGLTVRARRAGQDPVETTTDDEGRYRFTWPAPVDVYQVEAAAGPTTTAAARSGIGRIAGEPVRADLTVSGGATLEGVVLGPDDQPVSGARVRAWCREDYHPQHAPDRTTVADLDGRFVVEHLGEAFVLDALADGLACRYGLRGKPEPGTRATGLEVRMLPAVTFEGRVVDEAGNGVEGALLSIGGANGWSSADVTAVPGVMRLTPVELDARSDRNGAFTLGPAPRQTWNARVTHEDYLLHDFQVEPDEPAWVVLDRGCWLTGTVSGPSGPVAGAEVFVHANREASWRKARTDEDGRFRVQALLEGSNAFVLVNAPGYAVQARQPMTLVRGGGHVDLQLDPEWRISGRVVDAEGEPVPNASVRIEGDRRLVYEDVDFGEPTTWEWAAGLHRTHTDDDGRFVFEQLYEGAFRITAESRPGQSVSVSTRSGDEAVEIVLGAPASGVSFTGRVVDGFTGEPLDRFTVTPMLHDPDGTGSRGRGVSIGPGANGGFRLTGYEPGTYTLCIAAPGFATYRAEATATVGETRHDVRLLPARTLQLRVVDGNGEPTEARVQVLDPDGTPRTIDVGGMGTSDLQTRAGLLGLAGLPAGPVRVHVRGEHWEEAVVDVDLTRPLTEPVEVVLEGAGKERVQWRLAVLVTDEPELAGLHSLEDLRAAYEAGRVRMPRETITIDFRNARGRSLQTTTIEFLEAFRYSVRTEGLRPYGSWSEEGESEGPEFSGSIPATITRVLVTLGGHDPVQVDTDPEADDGHVLVLLEKP